MNKFDFIKISFDFSNQNCYQRTYQGSIAKVNNFDRLCMVSMHIATIGTCSTHMICTLQARMHATYDAPPGHLHAQLRRLRKDLHLPLLVGASACIYRLHAHACSPRALFCFRIAFQRFVAIVVFFV